MDRCPQCGRFGIDVDQWGQERCLWNDCCYTMGHKIIPGKYKGLTKKQLDDMCKSIKPKTRIED